jgi:hypothetical protein
MVRVLKLSIQNFYSHFTKVTHKCECLGRIVEPCLDVWNVRQTTSGVYAITVTTSKKKCFLYLLLSAPCKEYDPSWYISVIRQTVQYRTPAAVFTQPFSWMIRNKHIQIQYFTILLYLKCGLIRGASLEGEIQMFFTISMHMKCGFLRGVVSLKGTRKKYFTEMWIQISIKLCYLYQCTDNYFVKKSVFFIYCCQPHVKNMIRLDIFLL